MFHQDLNLIVFACGVEGVAENVAYGYDDAETVHNGWVNSPSHYENIINKTYNSVGVATAQDENGVIYHAEVFIVR